MPVLKRIRGGDYRVEPFEVNATQTLNWVSGSSDIDGFSVNVAEPPPTDYPTSDTGLGTLNSSGIYSYPLFSSVRHYFYDRSGSYTDLFQYYPSQSCWVVSIGSNYYGEGIKPSTFSISLGSDNDTIEDDGTGKLRYNSTGSIVGSLFYSHGVAVVSMNTSSATSIDQFGMQLKSGSNLTIDFESTVTIYEHTVVCVIRPNEFTVSINPTVFESASNGDVYNQYVLNGTQTPYITSIGMFNDSNECLAIAKVSTPIIRQKYTDQTFIIKFDE